MRNKFLLLFLLLYVLGNSQSINDLTSSFSKNIKSPQVTDFMRYGNISIKKNVGELDLNIPLLSVPTQDGNDISISLTYNASGFIPSKKSDIVGFNWNLAVGGVITREVVGEADDQMGSPETLNGMNGRYEHGYLFGIRQFGTNISQLPTDNDLLTINANKLFPAVDSQGSLDFYEIRLNGYPNNDYTRYETTSDKYSFSFNGITGKFFIAPDGSPEIITNEPHKLKIDLSGMSSQALVTACSPRSDSEIRITDELGNKYYFGKESKNLEYSVFLGGNPKGGMNTQAPVINSWYLYKIEYPNGELLIYNYEDDGIYTDSYYSGFCDSEQSMIWKNSTQHINFKKFIDFNILNNNNSSYGHLYSLTKKTSLSSIEYKDSKIKFSYSEQENLYKNTSSESIHLTPFGKVVQKKLDNIKLYHKTFPIKNIDFTYEVYNTQYPRIFLKSLKETGKEPYIFSYDTSNANSTPKPDTFALDYWGYYNGKLSNDSSTPVFFPGTNYSSNNDFEYTNDIREPNFAYSKMYALQSTKYPTGGSSYFEYEPHQYNKRLERKSDNSFLPKLYNINGIYGGTRIRKIYDNDLNSDQNIREFLYTDDTQNSSGILTEWPRYFFSFKIQRDGKFCSAFTGWSWMDCRDWTYSATSNIQTSAGYSRNILENSNISYSKVTEKTINKGSTTDYFTSYIDTPDIFYDNVIKLTSGEYSPMPSVQNILLLLNDVSTERGKLSKRVIKNEIGSTLEEQSFYYNENPSRFDKYHVSMNISNAWMHPLKNYYYNNFPSRNIIKKYFNGETISTETNYTYDDSNHNMLLSSSFKSNNNSTTQETSYKYAHEKGNQKLIDANMVGIPLITETKKDGTTISKIEILYPTTLPDTQTGNLLLPKSFVTYNFKDISSGATNPVSQTEIVYNKYDDKGNLQQYLTKDGITTAIIWGYNKTQPIAKVEGATYSQVSSLSTNLITASNADAALAPRSDESTFLTALNTFRNDSTLKDYQITTYTNDPLIGIRSVTPPNGITEFYKYDTANRLERILDKDNHILKELKYSSQGDFYNEEKSKTFTRNNCGAGNIGGTYTYVVPANTYSSSVSINDANAKALQDINNNGQNAANNNATCTYSCTAIPEDTNSIESYTSFHEISPNHFLAVVNVTFHEEFRFPVSLGLISSTCAPTGIRTYTHTDDNNKTWTITLNPNGSVIIKATPALIPVGQNVSFTFEYDK